MEPSKATICYLVAQLLSEVPEYSGAPLMERFTGTRNRIPEKNPWLTGLPTALQVPLRRHAVAEQLPSSHQSLIMPHVTTYSKKTSFADSFPGTFKGSFKSSTGFRV